MSSPRDQALDAVEAAIDFGNITSTDLSTGNEIRATVRGASQGDGAGAEELEDQEISFAPGVQGRPLDDTEGNVEAVIFRRGDELVILAFQDRRVRVSIAKGEVVVSNLDNDNPCRIRMRENGHVRIEAGRVDHCAPGETTANKALALAQETKAILDDIQSKFDAHVHPVPAPVSANTTAPTVPIGSLGSIASARVFTKD